MSALADLIGAIAKLEAEIKIATDLIKQQHDENMALNDATKRILAIQDQLKLSVDSASASGGTTP